MLISLIQIDSGTDKLANFEKAKKYIVKAAKQKPNIICLPENFLSNKHTQEDAENTYSKFLSEFQELAKIHRVNLILGSLLVPTQHPEKVTNTTFVINRNGEIAHRYDKMYMYNVNRPNITYLESENTVPGEKHGLFELEGIKIGVGICVDLRYPEYFRELAKQGVEIVFLPSNFRKATGKIAWDILTKARAIENQLYFCACGQTGGTDEKARCGNSRIISYDGSTLAEIGEEEGIVSANLDLRKLRQFRKEFPILAQIKTK